MSAIAKILSEQIQEEGPIRFDRFMEVALYEPDLGYYRRKRDPFGKRGDFFTAAQIQPLFGRIMAADAARLEPGRRAFDLGAGRREMAHAFGESYTEIEHGQTIPEDLSGFIFANEFFDALPVRSAIRREGSLRESLVDWRDGRFVWTIGPPLDPNAAAYAAKYWPAREDGDRFEIGERALEWLRTIAARMRCGTLLIVDYGFQTRETLRFPAGTLMSYSRHRAEPDVLAEPGERDITAHVAFDAIRDEALSLGFECPLFETLAQRVLRTVAREPAIVQDHQSRQQLKTLLAMGDTFLVMELKMAGK